MGLFDKAKGAAKFVVDKAKEAKAERERKFAEQQAKEAAEKAEKERLELEKKLAVYAENNLETAEKYWPMNEAVLANNTRAIIELNPDTDDETKQLILSAYDREQEEMRKARAAAEAEAEAAKMAEVRGQIFEHCKNWLTAPDDVLVGKWMDTIIHFHCSASALDDKVKALLRCSQYLQRQGFVADDGFKQQCEVLAWNDGHCSILSYRKNGNHESIGYNWFMKEFSQGVHGKARMVSLMEGLIGEALGNCPPEVVADLKRLMSSGPDWGTYDDAAGAIFAKGFEQNKPHLFLGWMPNTGGELLPVPFYSAESLVTIAPPGSGKTQALVLPNLVNFQGPALVLDVKGECHEKTAPWRSENVGPVIRFAPADPENSAHFNPLDAVSADPRKAWKEARLLADMLLAPRPGSKSDPYFENRARDLVTVLILAVVLEGNPDERHMGTLMDMLYPSPEDMAELFEILSTSEVDQLRRAGNMLLSMPEKQREAVYDSARAHLEIWQSSELSELCRRSDWQPGELRDGNKTLYLCVGLNEIAAYASVLRVIIGQLIAAETSGQAERGGVPLTLFLDELPRLGHMAPIEEALDVGRGFGVRLWMFAQNMGQLEDAYSNADGMVGNCAVQMYMNPDHKTAEMISKRMGDIDDVMSGKKKRLAEAAELTGPEYQESILIFGRGAKPLNTQKGYAFKIPYIAERLS